MIGATLYKAIQKKFGLHRLLSFLKESNFDFIEIYLPDEDLLTSSLDINSEKLEEVQEILSSYGFGITFHGLYDNNNGIISNLASLDDTLRKKAILTTQKSIELCNILDSHILVIHPGALFPDRKRKKASSTHLLASHPLKRCEGLKNIQRSLKKLLEYAEEFGVYICLENEVPRFESLPICDNPLVLAQLCQTLYEEHGDGVYGATLDIGHLALEAMFYGYDLLQTINTLRPFIKHIHLHDNHMIPSLVGGTKAESGRGDLHYPIGGGVIPYADLLSLLKDIGNDIIFNFEIFRIKNMEDFISSKQVIENS